MELPERFLEVIAVNKKNPNIKSPAILDRASENLIVFSYTDGFMRYEGFYEINECFEFLNPKDGFKYDLNKLL